MATPFVAGLAALVFREAPQLSAYQVRSIILGSIDAKSALTSRVSTGGRVNAYKAIVNAKAQSGAAPWTPSYTPEYKSSRSIASESAASPVAGCGLVKAIMSNNSGGGAGGSSATDLIVILCMVSLPLVVALRLRSKQSVQAPSLSRRTTERYDVSKKASIQLSNQTIDITTQDLSMGGISFKADTALAKGQIVKLKFNDSEAEQVEAEVVWCSKTKEYGLKFLNISESIKFEIQSWTQGLVPTN